MFEARREGELLMTEELKRLCIPFCMHSRAICYISLHSYIQRW